VLPDGLWIALFRPRQVLDIAETSEVLLLSHANDLRQSHAQVSLGT
jgi:hypothetical protein